jgi:ArsR family transcriptional regulator
MEHLEALLNALKAAAEPTRLRLLAICARSELTVTEVTAIVGQSQPRVSRHLKLLCNAGLLIRYREQSWVFYRVPRSGPGAEVAAALLGQLPSADPQLELDRRRLDAVLDRRAEAARALVEGDGQGGAARVEDEATVDAYILQSLRGEAIGELLDIGTGSGRMLRLLGQTATRAVGIDISRAMLMLARSNLHAAGLDHLLVRQGNMYQLRFADSSFDTVTIDQVLFQAEQPGQVLCEASRVLRRGGRLLLVEFLTAAGAAGAPGLAADLVPIDRPRLDGWFGDAGLALEHSQQLPGHPYPVILSVARREPGGKQAAA